MMLSNFLEVLMVCMCTYVRTLYNKIYIYIYDIRETVEVGNTSFVHGYINSAVSDIKGCVYGQTV